MNEEKVKEAINSPALVIFLQHPITNPAQNSDKVLQIWNIRFASVVFVVENLPFLQGAKDAFDHAAEDSDVGREVDVSVLRERGELDRRVVALALFQVRNDFLTGHSQKEVPSRGKFAAGVALVGANGGDERALLLAVVRELDDTTDESVLLLKQLDNISRIPRVAVAARSAVETGNVADAPVGRDLKRGLQKKFQG